MAERLAPQIRLDGLAYGGDYNPDQWSEDVWVEDARLMRAAGVNLVSLPVFSWPLLEPRPGEYDFGWLDRVIEVLWSHKIHVDLATATATPPAWLVRAHRDVLPYNRDGVRLEFGSRQAYCPSSPVLREYALRLVETMARRYGTHEALTLWHVSNEYGDHVSRCWCPVSVQHFRRWLQERYGTLDGLNDAWGTSVWGQHYTDWEHIELPRTATGPLNPTQQVDFERFSSVALLELFRAEVDVLHRITPDVPVTTNFMSLFRELDYWDFAAAEDVVTGDAYPDPADERAHIGAALNYGLMRSLKGGQPWLLLEQAPSAVSWRAVNVPKAPGQMRSMSMHAIAHGSDGAMFFQWRQAAFGPEKFHSAMLGHRGTKSRSFAETAALGAELGQLADVCGTRVRADVALVVDWDAWWGASAPDSLPSLRFDWAEQVRAWHAALYTLGQTVDVVRATGPFGGYDVVVVPNLYATTTKQADALTGFVNGGGTLVVGPFSGVVDHCEKVHSGGAPGPLRNLLGVEVDEWWPLPDGRHGRLAADGRHWRTDVWSEWIDVAHEVTVVAHYADGDLAGRPAVARREDGGTAWYVSAGLEHDGLVELFRDVLDRAGLATAPHAIDDVEVVTRTDGTTDYTFVVNHGRRTVALGDLPEGAKVLTGPSIVDARLTLGPFDVSVLAHPTTEDPPAVRILTSLTEAKGPRA